MKVQRDALHVRILHPHTNQLLREHLRQKRGGYRIEEEDHPKKMPLSTAQLLRRAALAGQQTGKFCQLLYDRHGWCNASGGAATVATLQREDHAGALPHVIGDAQRVAVESRSARIVD